MVPDTEFSSHAEPRADRYVYLHRVHRPEYYKRQNASEWQRFLHFADQESFAYPIRLPDKDLLRNFQLHVPSEDLVRCPESEHKYWYIRVLSPHQQ